MIFSFPIESCFSSNDVVLANLFSKMMLNYKQAMFDILNSHSYSKFIRCVDLIHLYEIPII